MTKSLYNKLSNAPYNNWQNDVPLKESWKLFSYKKHQNAFRKLDMEQPYEYKRATSKEDIYEIIEMQKRCREHKKNRKNLISCMCEGVRNKLSDNKLIAFGTIAKRNGTNKQFRIPKEFWAHAVINWHRGTAWDIKDRYHRIRVIDPARSPNAATKSKAGRRSQGDIIIAAIKASDAQDPELKHLGKKSRTKAARNWIEQHYPEINPYGENFSDDTFKKYLLIFDKRKE